jgi:hypothetical protein
VKRALPALCFLGIASASIRPHFWPERSAWDATDILVLAPLPERGSFEVVETIKGGLAVGAHLSLPKLAGDDQAPAIALREVVIHTAPHRPKPEAYLIPRLHGDQRLLVFLIRAEEGWRPAAWEWKAAAAWIEDKIAYGFAREITVGETYLMPQGSEGALRLGIRNTLAQREHFDRVLATPDDGERARKFGAIVREKESVSANAAVEKLSHGGRPAARVLFELIALPPVDWVQTRALELFRLSGNATVVVQERLQGTNNEMDQLSALRLITRLELWNALPDAKRFCAASSKMTPELARECKAISRAN